MSEYNMVSKNAAKILDNYNFEEDISMCKHRKWLTPNEVRDFIIFGKNDDILEKALNDLTEDELMRYLTEKYGVQWLKMVSYKMI